MRQDISGKTRVIGLLGWPVSHSMSPAMHNPAFEAAGLDFVYVCFPVPPEKLKGAVSGYRALSVAGSNVTIPHKSAVMEHLDKISEEARKIGAVNTIVNRDGKLSGYNTDVNGFLLSLKNKNVEVKGSRVVIIGAGGVSRAIAFGAAMNGASSITLTDIEKSRAESLGASLSSSFENLPVSIPDHGSEELLREIAEADIIANATPLGMKSEDPLPLSEKQLNSLSPDVVIFDAVYSVQGTKLQRILEEKNILYIGGLDMLLYQGVKAFELWTGQTPDVDLMRKVLYGKLG